MKKLGTTSHAILGLLALRPWTTYELATQLQRNLHYFWPRAESGVYEEPKNLVAHGLAKADPQRTGRRPRTVYSITDAGRAEMRRWLEAESEHAVFFSEALVRVWFGEQGDKLALLETIGSMRRQAEATQERGRAIATEYSSSEVPFPQRLRINALVFKFIYEQAETTIRWSMWAEQYIRRLDGLAPLEAADDALEIFRAVLAPPVRARGDSNPRSPA